MTTFNTSGYTGYSSSNIISYFYTLSRLWLFVTIVRVTFSLLVLVAVKYCGYENIYRDGDHK